ncbi:BZ3500_MvSof-1268-A1-R1_Chr4-3g07308 [Microbotryum saponariae]|uniref:BZ3500_MvSof-1268-A1-R1_Chr4-3g07308 protein n=1 Tax=Microbotryum saponariae TaxID=289078 RepID=A0A2X0LN73_9BASI|nr:BZ3500_MvSof-1268-A1-R1_Chr4-3g07308 [Microbotryum saponariae]SDA06971.1 BZ3501_MvSof-1269-A2-R1_Chr4-2g07017 [Microbotryum saponariae]
MIAERMHGDSQTDQDTFTPVKYRRKARNATPNGGGLPLPGQRNSTPPRTANSSSTRGKGKGKSVIVRERTLAERIEGRRKTFVESKYLEQCKSLLRNALEHDGPIASTSQSTACPTPTCAVCLGLGTLTDSPESQEQYLLLEALQDELGTLLTKPTETYDPVFDPQDIEYLVARGLLPLQTEHDLIFDTPTLLYMPHCPRFLFDLLLERSWSRKGLKNLIILGNRLEMYDDPYVMDRGHTLRSRKVILKDTHLSRRHASATSSAKSPFIARAAPLFTAIPLPPTRDHFQAFNDLALQWIPLERLDQIPDNFFDKALPPPIHNDRLENGHEKSRRREAVHSSKGDDLSEALERVIV